MITPTLFQTNAGLPSRSRSMGVKLLIVSLLALLMMLLSLFISGLVDDRRSNEADVIQDISARVGGQQTFLGPTLAVPYTVLPQSKDDSIEHGVYLVAPVQAQASVSVTTQERTRSLFKVPVFQADARMDGTFDLRGVPSAAPQGSVMDWTHAELLVGVSDVRGAQNDATVMVAGQTFTMLPAASVQGLDVGGNNSHLQLTFIGAPMDASTWAAKGPVEVKSRLRFSGAQRLAVLAYGKTTQLNVQGSWASPGFDGGFLPVSRTVSADGFKAEWKVPFIARGVRAEGTLDFLRGLDATQLGISFVEVADPYQSVTRSLKYAPLFLGLVFLSYFVFETTTGKRVHPAQYVLVGVAQLIFYLLLLSLAERTSFDVGFALGGAATVTLLAVNAAWVFASRKQGVRAFAVFTLLYGLIYLLLRLEDNALLVGAVASFVAVAATMYFTRKLDWYSGSAGKGDEKAAFASTP